MYNGNTFPFFTNAGAGITLLIFGIEGQHFDYVDDFPKIRDSVLNVEGYSISEALKLEGIYTWLPYPYHEDFLAQIAQDESSNRGREMTRPYLGYGLPPLNFTGEEQDRMNTLMQDIQTYKFETVLKLMMGTEPLSKFDEYVQKIRDMGIDEVLAIQQKRYDEFVNEM